MTSSDNTQQACNCDEVFEWPRGVAYDGKSYICPSCKGVVFAKDLSAHKIIPRSQYLRESSEQEGISNSPSSIEHFTRTNKRRDDAFLVFFWWIGIALLLLLTFGFFTGRLWGDPAIDCYDYREPNGNLVSTCDDLPARL